VPNLLVTDLNFPGMRQTGIIRVEVKIHGAADMIYPDKKY